MANKTMRFLSLLVAFVMVLGMFPVAHAHAEGDMVKVPDTEVATVIEDGTYAIVSARSGSDGYGGSYGNYYVKNNHIISKKGNGDNGLELVRDFSDETCWTITKDGEYYTISNGTDNVNIVQNGTVNLAPDAKVQIVPSTITTGAWEIRSTSGIQLNYYNSFGNASSTGGAACAWGGANDPGSQWYLYKVIEKSWDEVDPYGKIRGQWSTYHVDTETDTTGKEGQFWKAFDNNPGTHWHSDWQNSTDKLNGSNTFTGIIDLGKTYTLDWFSYTPRTESTSGHVTQASVYVSNVENPNKDNAEHWTLVKEHATFSYESAAHAEQIISFAPQSVRYVKFVAEASNDGWVTASEFNVGCNHEHEYTPSVTTAPTCTEAGVMTYTCSCGDSYTDAIKATGHSYTPDVTDPTCTEDGYTTYTCTCGDSYKSDVVPAPGHSYDDGNVTLAPTCTEAGVMTYTCACGDYYTEEIKATGHSYTPDVTDPTCTEDGYTTYTCACGDSYKSDVVPAPGHSYTPDVTDPTCTVDGYTTYTCACGDSYKSDVVPALGHSYDDGNVTLAPTCTEAGVMTYTCACGDYYTEEIKATGHRFSSVEVTSATCTENGYITIGCGNCGGVFVSGKDAEADQYLIDYPFFNLDATGHNYDVTAHQDATCTADGYTTYTCACGDSYTDAIEAKGHRYSSVAVTSATCTEKGYITITCGDCGSVFVSGKDAEADQYLIDYPFFKLDATGHNYETVDGILSCTNCGVIVHGVFEGCLYNNGVLYKSYQLVEFEGDFYFVNDYNKIAKSTSLYLGEKFVAGTDIPAGRYEFDANGVMQLNKNGVIDGYLYINGARQDGYQLAEFDGNFYFIYGNHTVATDARLYMSEKFVEGKTYNGKPLAVGWYDFDEEGKLNFTTMPEYKHGIVGGYLYINNVRQNGYQLAEFEGDFYFIYGNHTVATDVRLYMSARFVDGKDIAVGYYDFGLDGKMIIK